MPVRPIRLAVLLSGGGRTMVNLQQEIAAGTLDARISVVISSREGVRGVERARALGLRTIVADRRSLSAEAFQNCITQSVVGVDLVCMAGFLSLWRIPGEWQGRVVNIHPALLPDFGGRGMYGDRVHRAVLKARKQESGCTVHFCDNEYDHGPIILQRRIPLGEGATIESLASRVFAEECLAYPQAIQMIAEERARVSDGKQSPR